MPPIPSRLPGDVPDPITLRVKINDLLFDPKNPPRRIQDGPKMRQLRASIRRNSLIGFILVKKYKEGGKTVYMIVDGHRRITAARCEGYQGTVPCILVGEAQANRIYADFQCGMTQDATDRLFLFFNSPDKLTEASVLEIEAAIAALGGDDAAWQRMKRLAELGFSLQYYRNARRFAYYCGHRGNKEYLSKCIDWQIKFGSQSLIRALACKAPAMALYNCVFQMKKLNETYTETQGDEQES